jgi:hypothetical protein
MSNSLLIGTTASGSVKKMLVGETGNLQVDVVSMAGGGDATALNQTTMIGHLSNIETAVQGTLIVDGSTTTQPISAVALPLPTGSATSANQIVSQSILTDVVAELNSLNIKTTSVDTGAVVISSGSVSVSNLPVTQPVSGTVSVDNFPATQPISAVALPLPTGASTDTLQTAGNASLTTIAGDTTSLDGKITFGNDTTINGSLQQVLLYGKGNGGNLHAVKISNGGDLDVEIADFVKGQRTMANSFPVVISSDQSTLTINNTLVPSGTYNNLANDETIAVGALSTLTASTNNMRTCNILYQDTATTAFDPVDIEVSGDSGTNYQIVAQIYPQTNAGGTLRYGYYSFACGGITNIRIKNGSATDNYTNVKCSVFGSN